MTARGGSDTGSQEMREMDGILFDIKQLAIHDGPGLRTTVFFKGCPLRCRWCHNPEGLSPAPQLMYKKTSCTHCGLCRKPCTHEECRPFGRCLHICPNNLLTVSGRRIGAEELAARLARINRISHGGVTFSGGEPLMQAAFLKDLIPLIRSFVHDLAIETSGYADPSVFHEITEEMDHIFMDIKLADPSMHREHTGVSNELILQNLTSLYGRTNVTIRTPLIPGITDTPENLSAIKKLIRDLPHELLPYNEFSPVKYEMLGMEYPLKR